MAAPSTVVPEAQALEDQLVILDNKGSLIAEVPVLEESNANNGGGNGDGSSAAAAKQDAIGALRGESTFELLDRPIDETPGLSVAVIGAGLSGITAGVLLPVKVPGIELKIFDKNADVGGTWYENVYPGVRCDIPANVYQSTFAPKTQWTEEYAQGGEIRDYWQDVARKYDVYQYLRLKHQVLSATWNDDTAKWTLEIENLATGEKFSEEFNAVITAVGRFNAWKLPDYPGINDFKGHLRHSSNWDPNFDPKDKNVALIGNGASGIQVLTSLQPVVKHLDHYARSPTWIAGSFGGEGAGRRLEPNYYSPEQLQSFEDPDTYLRFRKDLEGKFYQRFGTVFKNSKENIELREEFKKLMAKRLEKNPGLLETIVPDFSPNCRRLTPGPGYLEALSEPNVSYISTPIERFTAEGIVTTDGVARPIDAVICATGANISMRPQIPILGRSGASLSDIWDPFPTTYLGLATPLFPNLLFIQGPNAAGHSGTVPNQVETQATYIAKLLRKVKREGIAAFEPDAEATAEWNQYAERFFEGTVWSEGCSSWANGGVKGGRVQGHWPGSARHCNFVRREPRWEDWVWTRRRTDGKNGRGGKKGNRFEWLGNGWTAAEWRRREREDGKNGKEEEEDQTDLTPYLKRPDRIDLRSYHEDWWEV